jgi:hypothetical protein
MARITGENTLKDDDDDDDDDDDWIKIYDVL